MNPNSEKDEKSEPILNNKKEEDKDLLQKTLKKKINSNFSIEQRR